MDKECIFCRIINGDMKATFVHRDSDVVAIQDLNPQAPVHLLVMPVAHIPRVLDLTTEHSALLGRIFAVAADLARERKLEEGFRLVINNGLQAGQSVYHLHFHLIGGRGMKWPPG